MSLVLKLNPDCSLAADLERGAICGDVRLEAGAHATLRRWTLDYIRRQPQKAVASILEAAGGHLGAVAPTDGGTAVGLPDGGHVMIWPEGVFFRDAEGNEDGTWFAAEILTETERELGAILQRLAESVGSDRVAAAA
jgi:hypothetical protein